MERNDYARTEKSGWKTVLALFGISLLLLNLTIRGRANAELELGEPLATDYYPGFGKLTITPASDGKVTVHFDHNSCMLDDFGDIVGCGRIMHHPFITELAYVGGKKIGNRNYVYGFELKDTVLSDHIGNILFDKVRISVSGKDNKSTIVKVILYRRAADGQYSVIAVYPMRRITEKN